jgi:hypothetical protein
MDAISVKEHDISGCEEQGAHAKEGYSHSR